MCGPCQLRIDDQEQAVGRVWVWVCVLQQTATLVDGAAQHMSCACVRVHVDLCVGVQVCACMYTCDAFAI